MVTRIMETKRIKCPRCGTVMDVTNSKREAVKHFKCPGCGAGLAVSFADSETEYHQAKHGKAGKPGLEYKGKAYPLATGDNIVGRKANTSSATLQIDTSADAAGRTMSREHLKIRVVELSGGKYKSMVSTYKAKNPTLVNGEQLNVEDCIVLCSGDTIKMGEVTVMFRENIGMDNDLTECI